MQRRWLTVPLALLLLLAGTFARPASAETGPPIEDLGAALQTLAERYQTGGEYGIAVTDLQTGETVGAGLDRPHLTACTVNFFVLLQATLDVQEGRYAEQRVGALISRTVWSSNPVTARELYRIVGDGDVTAGVERVAALIEEMGLTGTILDHPPGFGAESLGVNRNNWTTAADMNEALRIVYSDDLLRPEWRSYLLDKMTGVKPGLNYLTAIGPDGAVSHKNGFFLATDGTWVDNDVAIVRFNSDGAERAYAISFFSQWVPEQYGDVVLGQRVSVEAWDFFSAHYPAPAAAAR